MPNVPSSDHNAMHKYPFQGEFYKTIESEVTLLQSSTIDSEAFDDCPAEIFTDTYVANAYPGNRNPTKKLRGREKSAELGYKKGISLDQEHPWIRSRIEIGMRFKDIEKEGLELLEEMHMRGGEVVRRIIKKRRMRMIGVVQEADTEIVSVELRYKEAGKEFIKIDLDKCRYVDVEVESPANGQFDPQPAYDAITKVLKKRRVPDNERRSITTRGIIVEHLKNLSPRHELFKLRMEEAPLIVSQCLRFKLDDVFTQKGIPKRWKGE